MTSFKHLILLLTLSMFFTPAHSHAEEPQIIELTVPHGDKLAVRVPATWQHEVIQPKPGTPPTLRLKSAGGKVTLQITFIPDVQDRFGTKELVDQTVTAANQRYVLASVEKGVAELIQFESKLVRGSYSIFTDADLVNKTELGDCEYLKVTSGVFVIGKQACALTLLSNDTSSEDYKEAFKIITEGISIQ